MKKEILTIKITKDDSAKKLYAEMDIKDLDFKKEDVMNLIQHQFSKFKIIEK